MSEENVEIVRRAMDAFNAGDRDGLLRMCDPEIEFRSVAEQKTYRGLDGLAQYREDRDAVMGEVHIEDDQVLDAGSDRVVFLYRIVGRGAASGVTVSGELGALCQIRDGKVLKVEVFLDQTPSRNACSRRPPPARRKRPAEKSSMQAMPI